MLRFIFTIFIAFNLLLLQAQNILPPRCPYKGIHVTDSQVRKLADDFTITTTDGITRNLYNTLDSGKTVFVDLFYTTCSFCQLYAPVIEEVYQETGAGEGDVEFWGISNNLFDTNWVIDQYRENYGVSNPCAGPIGGGGLTAFSIIVNGQPFYGFPTYCVICPDRNMYFGVCYPPVADCFYPYFEDCTVGVQDNNTKPTKEGIISIYPNPSSDNLNIDFYSFSDEKFNIGMYDLMGKQVFDHCVESSVGFQTTIISINHLQNGVYFLEMVRGGNLIGNQKVLISR